MAANSVTKITVTTASTTISVPNPAILVGAIATTLGTAVGPGSEDPNNTGTNGAVPQARVTINRTAELSDTQADLRRPDEYLDLLFRGGPVQNLHYVAPSGIMFWNPATPQVDTATSYPIKVEGDGTTSIDLYFLNLTITPT